MAKSLFKFMVCVPDWFGTEFKLHECYHDDIYEAAEEFVQEHDDNQVLGKHNGIEVQIRRASDETVHALRVTAEATVNYDATDA